MVEHELHGCEGDQARRSACRAGLPEDPAPVGDRHLDIVGVRRGLVGRLVVQTEQLAVGLLYSVSKGIYPKEIGGPDPVPPPPKNGTNGTGEK